MTEYERLKERISHGDAAFPLCVYTNQTTDNHQILFSHWHEEVEFIFLRKGKATFYLDTMPVEIKAGEGIFVDSN